MYRVELFGDCQPSVVVAGKAAAQPVRGTLQAAALAAADVYGAIGKSIQPAWQCDLWATEE
ncbi:hypothetical protein NBRGN_029_00300 [Nocardia brasiliensis NBRC 14402]|nr:hypothetical protein NBRGN_029_00300 [Nocardia brasiliensis NBRC 14402]